MAGNSAAGWYLSLGPYGTTGWDGVTIGFAAGLVVLMLILLVAASRPRKMPRPALVWAARGGSPGALPVAAKGPFAINATVRPKPVVISRRKDPMVVRSGYRRIGPQVLPATAPRSTAPGLSKFVARRKGRP